jgi:ribose/xylose/arabinose/galactoside ABC-type transport system permease subunit
VPSWKALITLSSYAPYLCASAVDHTQSLSRNHVGRMWVTSLPLGTRTLSVRCCSPSHSFGLNRDIAVYCHDPSFPGLLVRPLRLRATRAASFGLFNALVIARLRVQPLTTALATMADIDRRRTGDEYQYPCRRMGQ